MVTANRIPVPEPMAPVKKWERNLPQNLGNEICVKCGCYTVVHFILHPVHIIDFWHVLKW